MKSMAVAILGKKVGMTRVYDDKGVARACTVVQAGPCTVLQVKEADTDGYRAVQVGFGQVKAHRSTKPIIGHARKANAAPPAAIGEIRADDGEPLPEMGSLVTVAAFEGIAWVDVTGTSKGKGFQGVMKRWHFGGQSSSHGTERKHRSPGSISAHGTNRGHGGDIKRGKRMAGHLGDVRRTVRNLRLLRIDVERNLLIIGGGVPGANGGVLMVRKSRTKS